MSCHRQPDQLKFNMDIDDSQFSLKISDCIMFDKETQVTIYNEDSMKLFQRGLRQISKYIKFYSGSSIGKQFHSV